MIFAQVICVVQGSLKPSATFGSSVLFGHKGGSDLTRIFIQGEGILNVILRSLRMGPLNPFASEAVYTRKFFLTACRTACKHAFRFFRVLPEAVSTRHSWL